MDSPEDSTVDKGFIMKLTDCKNFKDQHNWLLNNLVPLRLRISKLKEAKLKELSEKRGNKLRFRRYDETNRLHNYK